MNAFLFHGIRFIHEWDLFNGSWPLCKCYFRIASWLSRKSFDTRFYLSLLNYMIEIVNPFSLNCKKVTWKWCNFKLEKHFTEIAFKNFNSMRHMFALLKKSIQYIAQ